jgi:crotonobetainyl-CoA:carnitine CoA-transferase CaiB-like acyl-CoA transferase
MSVTGEPDGDPVKCGIPIGDLSAGLFCAVAILSAVIARERTGRGQRLDTSLFEGALALSIWETAELWGTGEVPQPLGSAHRLLAPYQALRTADGHLTVGANTQRLWELLCSVVGRPELVDDPRFARNPDRMAHRAELAAELEEALAARSTGEWVDALIEAGVPCGPIHDYRQVFEDPHTQAREMEVRLGSARMLGIPVKMSDTPGAIRRAAPEVGEHTEEVLREAGFSDAELAAL